MFKLPVPVRWSRPVLAGIITVCGAMALSGAVAAEPKKDEIKIVLRPDDASFDPAVIEKIKTVNYGGSRALRRRSGATSDGRDAKYSFEVPRSGRYRFRCAVTSKSLHKSIRARMELDGKPKLAPIIFEYRRVDKANDVILDEYLAVGRHELVLEVPDEVEIHAIIGRPGPPPPAVPEAAENYIPVQVPRAERPRLFVTPENLTELRARRQQPEFRTAWRELETRALETPELPRKDGIVIYNLPFLRRLTARALYGLLADDPALRRSAALDMLAYVGEVQFDNVSYTLRLAGETLYSAALVYDWTHGDMTASERERFRAGMMRMPYYFEMKWPPFRQSITNGHGNESQILRDCLAMAIAVYGEDNEPYRYCAYRIWEELLPARRWEYPSGRHNQGPTYGLYRLQYEILADIMLRRATGAAVFPESMQKELPRFMLYLQNPDRTYIEDGDNFRRGIPEATRMLRWYLLGVYSEDPVVKGEARRIDPEPDRLFPVEYLLLENPAIPASSDWSRLDLIHFFPEPHPSFVCRSSWRMGDDSAAAVVDFRGAMWDQDNHMHADVGAFQIFYRAPLATDLGLYSYYGSVYDYGFNKRTIAHNTMLAYDPSEKFLKGINDGGQRFTASQYWNLQALLDPANRLKRGVTEAVAFDPARSRFGYLKSDLAAAYSEKLKKYQRYCVYFNTGDPATPALFFVIDRVEPGKAGIIPEFVLNTLSRPEPDGRRLTVVNRQLDGKSGRLIVNRMLPEAARVTTVGGEDQGTLKFYGQELPPPPPKAIKACKTADVVHGYRTVIAPQQEEPVTLIANAMQIGDPDTPVQSADLSCEGGRCQARLGRHLVNFSADGKAAAVPVRFTIPDQDGAECHLLLTDLEPGRFVLCRNDGGRQEYEVSATAGALFLTLTPGRYELIPAK